MKKNHVAGTRGYAAATLSFIEATLAIDFGELHRNFVPLIPKIAGRVLDIGAGIGRDSSVLAEMGHSVVAVEPTEEFSIAGKQLYPSPAIEWLDDSLPELALLGNHPDQFDFILASGIWHHLGTEEQHRSIARVAQLLRPDGVFALTLRNGPAGAGSHIFPTNGRQLIKTAEDCGLATVLFLENQPSLMKNKAEVFWTKLAFQKQAFFQLL
jgi:SAM-dependent methyltransferase